MYENTLFSFVINDKKQTFTILGTLSAEEEVELTNLIAGLNNTEHNYRRLSFDITNSVAEEIENLNAGGQQDYRFVSANEVIPDM